MRVAAVWLTLFVIGAGTRLVLDVDDVRALALTDDLIHGSGLDELDVDLFGEFATGSWLVDRVATGLERSQWIWCLTVIDELVTMISFLATVLAAPVARAVLTTIGEVDLVRCWFRAWQPFVDGDEFMAVQSSTVAR